MICKLLRVFKLFYLSTSLFNANTTVYMHPHHNDMVAISHFANHHSLNIHQEITFVKNNEYIKCFNETKNVFNINIPKSMKSKKPVMSNRYKNDKIRHRYLFNRCMKQLQEMREILEED